MFSLKFSRYLAAFDHDCEFPFLNTFRTAASFRRRNETQPYRCIMGGAESAAGDKADNPSVSQHRFIVVQHGIGVCQPDRAQIWPLPVGPERQIAILTNERAMPVRLADEVEPHLVRRLGIGHIRAPVQVSFFDTKGIQRLAACQAQAEQATRFENDLQTCSAKSGVTKTSHPVSPVNESRCAKTGAWPICAWRMR